MNPRRFWKSPGVVVMRSEEWNRSPCSRWNNLLRKLWNLMLRIKWNKIRSFICRRHISHLRGKYFTSKIFHSLRRNEFHWKDLNLCKKYLWTSMVLWHLLLYCLIKTQVKYPADAGCEMFALRQTWNIAPSSQCEIKFARVRAANISRELSHFTRRRRISLARKGKFHWKRHLQLIAVLNKTTISFSEIARLLAVK